MSSTIKVLFSLRQIRPGASGGIAPYAKNLAEQLALNPKIDLHLAETFFNHKTYCQIDDANVTRHLLANPGQYNADLVELIRSVAPDIVLYPVAGDPIPEVGNERYFICIADLQHLTFPSFFTPGDIWARNVAFKEVAQRSAKIVTLSTHAKKDICAALGVDAEKVEVISPALDSSFQPYPGREEMTYLSARYNVTEPYLYYPANFWQHKNHAKLFEAMKLVKKTHPELKLVLTGDLFQARPELVDLISSLHLNDTVINLGYVDMIYVKALMSNARVMVFPSLFEGFGIPVLEALACNRIVCCSNTTSLPEVGGEVAFYFDPEDQASIARAIDEALAHDMTPERESATKAQVEKFSYAKSAAKLVDSMMGKTVERVVSNSLIDEPLVSIITPSFNQGQFIAATIESVLAQSYPNIEFIVKDGGSTDNTLAVLEKYKDVLSYTSGPDDGQTAAINSGQREAGGKYLCYLNSDDTIEPDAISMMVRYLEQNPQVDVVYGKADYIDKDGAFMSHYETYPWEFERFKGHCYICQPATMWRRATIEKFGEFDDSLHFVMDYEYWIRIAANGGTLAYCEEKFANSRLYDETKTRSGRESIFKEIRQVTRKHLGKTSPLWTYQHSRYLIEEKYPIARIFGRRFQPTIARTMARLMTACRDFPETSKFFYRHFMQARIANAMLFFRRAMVRAQRTEVDTDVDKSVTGLYSDGWVSRNLSVNLGKNALLPEIKFMGSCPCKQNLNVDLDGIIQVFELNVGFFELSIPVPDNHVQRVKLCSDSALKEATGRELMFHLYYTNLFNDMDVVF